MSTCPHLPAIAERLAREEPLTAAQAEHARGCATCGPLVESASRLAEALPRAARALASEPLPSADELLAAREGSLVGRWLRLGGAGGPSSSAPRRRGWLVPALLALVTVLVAAVGTGLALRLLAPTPTGPSPNPASSWVLYEISLPFGYENGGVLAASPDVEVVLFATPPPPFPAWYVVTRSHQVRQLALPGVDNPILQPVLSPDGTWILFWESGHLWRYEVSTGQANQLPDPPGTDYVDFPIFLTDSTAALLTGPIGTPDQGPPTVTQLWSLDLPTATYTKIGVPGQAAHLYALTDGIAVGVDAPDGTGSTLYRVAGDGSLEHLADAAVQQVWLAPDAKHFAYLSSDASSTIVVDVATGVPNRISRGTPSGFSPDGKLLRIDFPDGTAEAVYPDGTLVRGVVDGAHAAWVAASSGIGLPTPPPPPPVIALPSATNLACTDLGLGGATIAGSPSDPQVVWLVSGDGKRMATKLVWPPGYAARFNPDLQVLDASGRVVYLAGDPVAGGCLEGPSSDPQSTLLILPPGS